MSETTRGKTYDERALRELYRRAQRYWSDYDCDILPAILESAMQIHKDYWSEISTIAEMVVRTGFQFETLVGVLAMFGMGMEPQEECKMKELKQEECKMKELKPCPFCGGEVRMIHYKQEQEFAIWHKDEGAECVIIEPFLI